ncbi:MAG TPA: hypothetical protein VMT22_24455 [Terriglobales bacterium]|jgi:arginine-tRNA-protein transferase|nr:hypothetical protein [Terriglobales bacterium]
MKAKSDDKNFLCLDAAPRDMDRLWATGWRHFGIYFFRYRSATHGDQQFSVLPLRVDLQRFVLTRSQKRVLAKNADVRILFRPTAITKEKERLFELHRLRFTENIPSSLENFLSPVPDSIPCVNLELCVYQGKKLIGATFLDIGQIATSAVYAMFDPAEAKRSLGILMMLQSIAFSRERGFRYYYPGYAYREPFAYDYKKRLRGLEYLDWQTGWQPYANEAV